MHIALLVTRAEFTGKHRFPKSNLHAERLAELDIQQNVLAYKKALKSQGHHVYIHEGDYTACSWLSRKKPDICFNLCEGLTGESREAHIPAMLEMLGIPYTGPTPLAAAITQDKAVTKKILAFHNIPTPKFQVFTSMKEKLSSHMTFPLFVKPVHEGTGMGIHNDSIAYSPADLQKSLKHCIATYKQPALVEEYITGKDLTCGLIGNGEDVHIFPVSEIDFSGYNKKLKPIYGIEQKITYADQYKNKCPAPLSPKMTSYVQETTKKVFEVTGCRDLGRVDFRLTRDNKLYVLEINALPGVTPNSDLTLTAYTQGWKHQDVILEILHAACKRYNIKY